MRRHRSRHIGSKGAWRVGGLVGALVYSLVMWGVFFQVTPRVVAWLGQKQASAAAPAAAHRTAPKAPDQAH